MTDKQIMIDGVDISGCKNFSCGKCEEENKIPKTINHFTADCRMYPNCYFKQLARKTQECEELKERLERIEEDLKYQCVDCMNVKSDRYRKALEEIEKIVSGNYEILDPLAKQQISSIVNKAKGEGNEDT